MPLQSYQYIDAHHIDEVEDAIAKVFEPRHYFQSKSEGPLNIKASLVRLPFLDIASAHFGEDIQEIFQQPAENYFLLAPMNGDIISNHSGKVAVHNRSAIILSPGEMVDLSWPADCTVVFVRIRPQVLESFCQTYYGISETPEIILPEHLDMRQAEGLSLANMIHTLTTELEDENSLLSRGITSRHLTELLMMGFVNMNQAQIAGLAKGHDKKLNTAVDYIMANLKQPLTLEELANVSGSSIRKLQADFSKQFNVGPKTYIKQARLRQVRQALQQDNNLDKSVGDIAAEWGFFHASHFSREYKKLFGESPSETQKN
ncbi:AraC family transcriptional regulator [Maricurvus nonylphenolicus]|uniref:AraC family transcriptional regulator n=1 Tax=Maricurvus nonylphenolicus TaxID=1008307 RepID=UPI0036F25CFC